MASDAHIATQIYGFSQKNLLGIILYKKDDSWIFDPLISGIKKSIHLTKLAPRGWVMVYK